MSSETGPWSIRSGTKVLLPESPWPVPGQRNQAPNYAGSMLARSTLAPFTGVSALRREPRTWPTRSA